MSASEPRRLRLPELLRELGALDEGPNALPRDARISVGTIVDKADEAGFGFFVAVLALIAIPFVGVSTPFGLAIALAGVQLTVGRQRPWLPRRVRERGIPLSMLDKVAGMLEKRTRFLERMTRRRWEWLLSGTAKKFTGFGMTLLAVGLALPIPVPGSNFIFLVPLFVYAIGLLERDGGCIAAGHLGLMINAGLFIAFGSAVQAGISRFL